MLTRRTFISSLLAGAAASVAAVLTIKKPEAKATMPIQARTGFPTHSAYLKSKGWTYKVFENLWMPCLCMMEKPLTYQETMGVFLFQNRISGFAWPEFKDIGLPSGDAIWYFSSQIGHWQRVDNVGLWLPPDFDESASFFDFCAYNFKGGATAFFDGTTGLTTISHKPMVIPDGKIIFRDGNIEEFLTAHGHRVVARNA